MRKTYTHQSGRDQPGSPLKMLNIGQEYQVADSPLDVAISKMVRSQFPLYFLQVTLIVRE